MFPKQPAAIEQRSIKIDAVRAKALEAALDALAAHIAPAAEVWPQLTPAQRQDVLTHSPVLTSLIAMTEIFRGNPY